MRLIELNNAKIKITRNKDNVKTEFFDDLQDDGIVINHINRFIIKTGSKKDKFEVEKKSVYIRKKENGI